MVDSQEKGWQIVKGGDCNAHIGNGDAGIVRNNEEVNSNGRRLVEFKYGMDMEIVNRWPGCNGLWATMVANQRSFIDYFLVERDGMEEVKGMEIGDTGKANIDSDHN